MLEIHWHVSDYSSMTHSVYIRDPEERVGYEATGIRTINLLSNLSDLKA